MHRILLNNYSEVISDICPEIGKLNGIFCARTFGIVQRNDYCSHDLLLNGIIKTAPSVVEFLLGRID